MYNNLRGNKAIGIDGVTKERYGTRLDENLDKLLISIRRGTFRPRAASRRDTKRRRKQ